MLLKIDFLFGLEIHVFSIFKKKIFNFFDYKCFKNYRNNRISYLDIGLPGVIPFFNFFFLKKIVFFGFFLKNFLFYLSFFVRKSYFYPDMPKNYQITQNFSNFKYGLILIYNNYYNFPYYKFINIQKFHIEEDSAKINYNTYNKLSIFDFNRSNTFLLEIVSFYNLKNFYEIYIYCFNIKKIFFFKKKLKKYFRFDLNMSSKYFFYNFLLFKIEIKNLDSFFILKNVINFEINRQIYSIFFFNFSNETRFYNFLKKITYFVRSKESFLNYKYFLEPEKEKLYINLKSIYYLKLNITLNYYIKIYFFYNFNLFFYFNFFILDFFLFFFKYNLKLIISFLYNFRFLIKNINFSVFQILILLKCFFNNVISFTNFKKLFLFLYKTQIIKLFIIYKLIKVNNLLINSNIFNLYFFINFILINNIKFIHNFFFNKKIFNFFLGKIIKLKIFFNFNLLFKNKILF